MRFRAVLFAVVIGLAAPALAQEGGKVNPADWPGFQAGDYVIKDYKFASGETLPELRLHYRTIGTAQKNARGEIVNGVLLLQGNTGTGDNWFRPTLAGDVQAGSAARSGEILHHHS